MESDLSIECPKLVTKLEELISKDTELSKDPEALAYALATIIESSLKASDMEAEEQGATISNINTALKELFKCEIVMFQERISNLLEQKHSTIH